MSIKEIEFIVKSLQKKKFPSSNGSTREFYQTFKKIASIIYKIFSRKKKERFPAHLMRSATPWYQNQTNRIKLQVNISREYRHKNPTKSYQIKSSNIWKKNNIHEQVGLCPQNQS